MKNLHSKYFLFIFIFYLFQECISWNTQNNIRSIRLHHFISKSSKDSINYDNIDWDKLPVFQENLPYSKRNDVAPTPIKNVIQPSQAPNSDWLDATNRINKIKSQKVKQQNQETSNNQLESLKSSLMKSNNKNNNIDADFTYEDFELALLEEEMEGFNNINYQQKVSNIPIISEGLITGDEIDTSIWNKLQDSENKFYSYDKLKEKLQSYILTHVE